MAHMDAPYCPSQCAPDLSGASVGQSFDALPNRYSVSRWAVSWDVSGLADSATRAYSQWAKSAEQGNSGYSTILKRCAWDAYDTATDCQLISCTNVCNIKTACESGNLESTIMTEAYSLNTYRDSGNMNTVYINSRIGSGSVYYVVLAQDDDDGTAPPVVLDSSYRTIHGGPGSSYPAILVLVTQEQTRVFGTIVG